MLIWPHMWMWFCRLWLCFLMPAHSCWLFGEGWHVRFRLLIDSNPHQYVWSSTNILKAFVLIWEMQFVLIGEIQLSWRLGTLEWHSKMIFWLWWCKGEIAKKGNKGFWNGFRESGNGFYSICSNDSSTQFFFSLFSQSFIIWEGAVLQPHKKISMDHWSL